MLYVVLLAAKPERGTIYEEGSICLLVCVEEHHLSSLYDHEMNGKIVEGLR